MTTANQSAESFDVAVIGAGPAGTAAALRAAELGARVAPGSSATPGGSAAPGALAGGGSWSRVPVMRAGSCGCPHLGSASATPQAPAAMRPR